MEHVKVETRVEMKRRRFTVGELLRLAETRRATRRANRYRRWPSQVLS